MPAFTYAGGQYPVAGDSLTNLRADMQALVQSVAPRSVPSFADVAARNSAYSADIAAGRAGMRCWIVNRAGYSFYNGVTWKWEPQRNLIYDGYRASAVETSIITPGSMGVEMTSVYDLPPGNRQLHVSWGSMGLNISSPLTPVAPRVQPLGAGGSNIGIPEGRNWAQTCITVANTYVTFENQAFPVLSGSIQIKLFGASGNGSASGNTANLVRFGHTWMTIYDLGPTDD